MFAHRRWILSLTALCLVPLLGNVAMADPDEVRERWEKMSPEERERVRDSYRRWKKMSDSDRDLMRRRHENYQRVRDKVHDSLEDEDRRRLRGMSPEQRRRELDGNARDFLRRVKESLPAGIRDRLYESMHGVPPWERSRELSRMIREEVTARLPGFVRNMVERGNITEQEAEQFHQRLAGAEPHERFLILRQFLLKDPEGFGVPPNLRPRWEKCNDPHRAVKMMHEMRPRRMSLERKMDYVRGQLEERGMPTDELDALRGRPEREVERALDALVRDRDVSPPSRMQRWLLSQGVPKAEVDACFAGDRDSVKDRLRELMDRYGLERERDGRRGREREHRRRGDEEGRDGDGRSGEGGRHERNGSGPPREERSRSRWPDRTR